MTLPSRTMAAGSEATARVNSAAHFRSIASARAASAMSAEVQSARRAASVGRRAKVSRKPERSRGRALPNAIRDATRSTSTVRRSSTAMRWRSGVAALNSAIATWRAAATSWARSGMVSHMRNKRLPALVVQASSSDSSVGAGSPRSVSVISRLRRVAASNAR